MIIRGIMIADLLAHAGKIFLALLKTRREYIQTTALGIYE